MESNSDHVIKEIESNNPWYSASQFAWSEKESIRRIYNQRLLFFSLIVKREMLREGKVALLDYGCGDGYWSLIFSQLMSCDVTGIDYNPLRLERARSTVKNLEFIEADITKQNVQLGKYDIVFCSQVIEHVKDDISFLKNIRKCLNDDGILILGTTNEGCLTQRIRKYIAIGKTDHVHFYKEKEFRSKIEKAGFIIKDIYREVFYPGFDRLFYRLTSTDLGFKILELLTILFPSQCSDYYFECKIKK